jgi:hypothetical protein
MRRLVFALPFAAALTVGSVQAQTIATNPPPGGPATDVVAAVTHFTTDFNTVGGMTVNWTLTGGSSSGTWADLGQIFLSSGDHTDYWGVWTNSFKLWAPAGGDSFSTDWKLWATNLTGFSINALSGKGAFDIIGSPDDTQGSSSGKPFNWAGNDQWNTTVTYSTPVDVLGQPTLPDEWGSLSVDFGQNKSCAGFDFGGSCDAFVGGHFVNIGYTFTDIVFGTSTGCNGALNPIVNQSGSGDNTQCYAQFAQDLDNIAPLNVTPEPGTMSLLAMGLVGMAGVTRRKRKNS